MSKLNKASSKDVAFSRLTNVLKNDRSQLDQQVLEAARSDIIRALGAYMQLDENDMQVTLKLNDHREKPRLIVEAGVKKIHRSLVGTSK